MNYINYGRVSYNNHIINLIFFLFIYIILSRNSVALLLNN